MIYDKTFVNPRRATVLNALSDAILAANDSAKIRLVGDVSIPEGLFGSSTLEGRQTWDGDGVSGSYRYTAQTSVVTIGWWKSGRKKYVRIKGQRTVARRLTSEHHLMDFGWAGIFPERCKAMITMKALRIKKAIERRGGKDSKYYRYSYLKNCKVVASSKKGLILCHRKDAWVVFEQDGVAQVTTIPFKFVNPKAKFFHSFNSESSRVNAAFQYIKRV